MPEYDHWASELLLAMTSAGGVINLKQKSVISGNN